MTNETTDNTDEPSKAELHDRVEKLESTVAKMMPSRRDALKFGAAGLAGAAGLSATSQSAEASTGSAGTIGSTSDRPDLLGDEIDASQLTLGPNNEYRTAFTDSELTDALNAASQGDHVRLGSEDFTQNRTITTDFITISGTGPMFTGSNIKGDWTLDGEIIIQDLSLGGTAQITINQQRCRLSGLTLGGSVTVTVNANKVMISDIIGSSTSVTFASGTSKGIIDSSTGVTVTDNGSNTIGDIA